ncbi:MAG TPA: YicC family protein [Bacteroidales bacterium]|jgi:uncharacterized protein (TIGR00255 family)|nr:YicC family protein [Bacteroidales bacterium]
MLKSMTGFGKAVCELKDKVITIEIKSLNSKQLDIFTRIPAIYREKDLDIRNLLSNKLKRGKIEFNLIIEITDAKNAGKINAPVVKEYYKQLKEIGNELKIDYNDSILGLIMRLPESLKIDKEELDDSEWKKVTDAIQTALTSLNEFRNQEGAALKKDLLHRINKIEETIPKIKEFEADRIKSIREKLESSLNEYSEIEKVDTNRLEQELIYYLEKLDITEEKVRLRNHCTYFKEVIESSEPVGKKLGFIGQEIGREVNTIGSKANNHDIQKLVVEMKDELEKIKEQVLNVL